MDTLDYGLVRPSLAQSDLTRIASYLFWLMFRNIASDGFVFEDPVNAGILSRPGCVIASPSWENSATRVSQDYVYNWTRDAAVVAMELAVGPMATDQPLIDYVNFARLCQNSGGAFDRACYLVDGTPRNWTDQADGPALQTLAILAMYGALDAGTQATARAVVTANLNFLRDSYQGETYNLWEEVYGASFFARSVHLRCLRAMRTDPLGIGVPDWVATAIGWLENSLQGHWTGSYYQSMLPAPNNFRAPYDPNIDIVMAAVYGGVAVADTRLLATAALLRAQWADPASKYFYPINGDDRGRGIGPLLGRYPGDVYDGDTDAQVGDHPWALCTANFAELHYRLAAHIDATKTIPLDENSAGFFDRLDIGASTTPDAAVSALRTAGDRMLDALVFHSDHLELSEQFDATSGYQKSVRNLSWSYAAFLSAVRAREYGMPG
ncbi:MULTISPECIES: glycoside hydrolase family 15 protein [unclassified Nocardia]|uniref:glycoside hydrolase family 15 protein n=1 Tax=unclassified Nocardia TaxID=2637762 RepID=UPI001CE43F91|nr:MULTISPECIES: glycoside hydrolase family 15 protein [unclassified Nocardia]